VINKEKNERERREGEKGKHYRRRLGGGGLKKRKTGRK
jgi:hypothetical protein